MKRFAINSLLVPLVAAGLLGIGIVVLNCTGCASSGNNGPTPTDGLIIQQVALTTDTAVIQNAEQSGKITGANVTLLATDESAYQAAIAQGFTDISDNVNGGQVSAATEAALTATAVKLATDEALALK